MADTKISALTSASALGGTEVVPVVQSGNNRKTTAQDIANLAPLGSISGLSAASALDGSELVPVSQSGTNKRTTAQDIADLAAAGSGGWTLAASWSFSVAVAQVDFTSLGSYSELLILLKGITLSISGTMSLRVSTDNGSTFLSTSGDYQSIATATGAEGALAQITIYSTASASARTSIVEISGFSLAAPKPVRSMRTDFTNYYIPTTTALNAIRLFSTAGGNLTAGDIYVLGR